MFITPGDSVTLITVDERKKFKIVNDKRGYYKVNGVPLELAIEQYKSNPANNFKVEPDLEQRYPKAQFISPNALGKPIKEPTDLKAMTIKEMREGIDRTK